MAWVTLRASRLESDSNQAAGSPSSSGPGRIAVPIEESTAGPRLELFARSNGLSGREQQLLGLLGRGADTRDIAAEMLITEYTVQDHLKSIFNKTSLNSRSALILTSVGPHGKTGPAEQGGAVLLTGWTLTGGNPDWRHP